MPDRKTLYLLVEESDREFLARCLIGVLAVEAGFEVVIGPQWWVWDALETLPPGVMLFKGNNTVQAVNMRRARRAGHAVASIEEEALGVIDEGEIVRLYDREIAAAADLLLVQSRFQADCLERHFPDLGDRVQIVGNPRVDLLRPPFDTELRRLAADLRTRYGPFVLFNTNFGSVNPAHGDALTYFNRCVQTGVIDPGNAADMDDFHTWCQWERDNARVLVDVMRRLRESLPGTRLILRPHPSESLERWRRCLEAVPGIEIIREGAHLPWTIASAVMVHTGCTTGLEAAVLGAPALSLTPGDNRWHGMSTSNVANPTANTAAEAVERVAAHLCDPDTDLGRDMAARDFSRYLDIDAHTLAASRVVDALARLDINEAGETPGIVQAAQSRLSDWQKRKYGTPARDARRTVTDYAEALEISAPVTVEGIADGAIVLRGP